jgi:predicted transport protein
MQKQMNTLQTIRKSKSFKKYRIIRYSKNVLDVDCQTQGRLKLMIELYVSEICHKLQIPYRRA